jgi:hypothetical protein
MTSVDDFRHGFLPRSIFMQLHDVKLEKAKEELLDDSSSDDVRDVPYARFSRTPGGLSSHDRGGTRSSMSSQQPRSTTPPKIDKRLHQHFVSYVKDHFCVFNVVVVVVVVVVVEKNFAVVSFCRKTCVCLFVLDCTYTKD